MKAGLTVFFAKVASASRKVWVLSEAGAVGVKVHKRWGTFYKGKDGFWWAKDITEHGASRFKVFKETPRGLEWIENADEFGDFIKNQHKCDVGTDIPWDQFKTIK